MSVTFVWPLILQVYSNSHPIFLTDDVENSNSGDFLCICFSKFLFILNLLQCQIFHVSDFGKSESLGDLQGVAKLQKVTLLEKDGIKMKRHKVVVGVINSSGFEQKPTYIYIYIHICNIHI